MNDRNKKQRWNSNGSTDIFYLYNFRCFIYAKRVTVFLDCGTTADCISKKTSSLALLKCATGPIDNVIDTIQLCKTTIDILVYASLDQGWKKKDRSSDSIQPKAGYYHLLRPWVSPPQWMIRTDTAIRKSLPSLLSFFSLPSFLLFLLSFVPPINQVGPPWANQVPSWWEGFSRSRDERISREVLRRPSPTPNGSKAQVGVLSLIICLSYL
jgi:hypothetical protein